MICIVHQQGIVEPHSVCDVPLMIEAQTLEEQDVMVQLSIFGSQDPPLVSSLTLSYIQPI